ncbi:hypothetical protein HK405_009040, partial [Cladochytrium tenue]
MDPSISPLRTPLRQHTEEAKPSTRCWRVRAFIVRLLGITRSCAVRLVLDGTQTRVNSSDSRSYSCWRSCTCPPFPTALLWTCRTLRAVALRALYAENFFVAAWPAERRTLSHIATDFSAAMTL